MNAPEGRVRRLSGDERRTYLLLGVPALGLGLAATTLTAYLPVLARELTTSHFLIGGVVGGEGLIALLLPVCVGAASDRVHTRLGPRLPFLLATAPPAALGLALAPFGRSILALGIDAVIFYASYFTYYAPYRALYSDIVPRAQSGRAQGIQALFRGAGMGSALVGGALLMPLWRPMPFVVAAAVLLAMTLVAVLGLRHRDWGSSRTDPDRSAPAEVWALLRGRRDIRWFMLSNVLWQLTEGGLKTFIVLYLRRGLHKSFAFSAGAMAVVAAAAVLAAPLAGRLADRYGAVRVMRVLLLVFGAGLCVPTFSRSLGVLLPILPVVGMGGAMAFALPYTILMQIAPRGSHGAAAGLFDLSGGAGSLLGPVVTGAAIDLLRPVFVSTQGYAAMWPVIGLASLASMATLSLGKVGQAPP